MPVSLERVKHGLGSPPLHSPSERVTPSYMRSWKSTAQPGSAIVANQMLKTKLCIDHHTKGCVRGAKCPYAHSVAEMRTLPDLQKTKMCSMVLAGKECKSKNCKYAHSDEELRYSCQFSEFRTRVCRFAKEQGGRGCLYGDRCPYAHSTEEMRMLKTPTIPQTNILVHKKTLAGAMHCDEDAPGRKKKLQQGIRESVCHAGKLARCATKVTAHDLSSNHLAADVCTKTHVKHNNDKPKVPTRGDSPLETRRNSRNSPTKNQDVPPSNLILHEKQQHVKFEPHLPNFDAFSEQMLYERRLTSVEPNFSMPISLRNVKRASTTGAVQMPGSIPRIGCHRLQIDVSSDDAVLRGLSNSFSAPINYTTSVPAPDSTSGIVEKPTVFTIPNDEPLAIHSRTPCTQPVNTAHRHPINEVLETRNDIPNSFAPPVKCTSYVDGSSLITHNLCNPCIDQLPSSISPRQDNVPAFSTLVQFGREHPSCPYLPTGCAFYQNTRDGRHSVQGSALYPDSSEPIVQCNVYSPATTLPPCTFEDAIDSKMQPMNNSKNDVATEQLATSESQALRDCLVDLLQSQIASWGCGEGSVGMQETSGCSNGVNSEDISQFYPAHNYTGSNDLSSLSDLCDSISTAFHDGCPSVVYTTLMRILRQSVAQQVDTTQKPYLDQFIDALLPTVSSAPALWNYPEENYRKPNEQAISLGMEHLHLS